MINRIDKTYQPKKKNKTLLCADKTRHLIIDDQTVFYEIPKFYGPLISFKISF